MRILLVGLWRWPQYEEAFARGLRESGAEVIEFRTSDYFGGFLGRVQAAFPVAGPAARRIGAAVIATARREAPDIVLFWRPTHPLPSTLHKLRSMGIPTVSYNNDDPFSPLLAEESTWRGRHHWRLYNEALPLFDVNFFFRQINCTEAMARGARHADVLLPYFLPWQHRPIDPAERDEQRFDCDVVFVGHFEEDGRDADLIALSQMGAKIRVWGDDTWDDSALAKSGAIPGRVVPAYGADYAKALSGGKICLCYLSKLNRDGYTTRCFEIPAVGRVMLAERTPELIELFREDEEACFFSSREELLQKVGMLLGDDALRERIAEAGLRRVWSDAHDVTARARDFMDRTTAALQLARTGPHSAGAS